MLLMVKNPAANAGDLRDMGSVPGLGRSPRGGNGNPLQCPCLRNPMDRGTWWATVHGVTQSRTRLKRLSMHAHDGGGVLFGRQGGGQFLSGSRESDQRWLGMVARLANMELGKTSFRPSLVTWLHDFRLIS